MAKRVLVLMGIVAVLALGALPLGAADKRDITIVNKAGEPITEIYIALVHGDEWGEDVLGEDVLEDGETVDIHFSGYAKKDCRLTCSPKTKTATSGSSRT